MARFFHYFLPLTLVAGLVSATGYAEENTPPSDPLRLPEALLPGLQPILASALEASPRVLQSRLAVAVARAGEDLARAGLNPTLSAGAGVDGRQEIRRDLAGTQYSFKFSYGLVATLPLWHWDALANRARMGEIQRQLAEQNLAEARRNLVLELRAQYAGLVLLGQDMAQARWAGRRRSQQLQRDEARAARGEVPALDLADLRLAVQESVLATERLGLAWNRARGDFAALIGVKDFPAENMPGDIPAVPDWTAGLRPPEGAAPVAGVAALAQAAGVREVARIGEAVERVRRRPTFDLVAGVTQDEVNYTANIAAKFGAEIHYLGVRMNWNIFDGGASQASAGRANAELRQKSLAYDLAAQALQRQLADGWQELTLAQRELAAREARLVQSAARLAADRPQLDAGQISADDWDRRMFEHEQVRLDLLRLRAAQLLRVAEYALLRARGTQPAATLHFP
ncbi:MAG: TolC family protein [Verrucomicrobiota bacterium]